jgi:hypothetical protein
VLDLEEVGGSEEEWGVKKERTKRKMSEKEEVGKARKRKWMI